MIVIKLNEVMGRKRMKIVDVMKAAGLARNTVAGLYEGTSERVDLDTLNKLCNALECPLEDILVHVAEGE
jgi:putative transcriptional regulator